jgi:hypothetical protein
MSDDAKRLGESFVTAYELIRGLTETVSDLTKLITSQWCSPWLSEVKPFRFPSEIAVQQ